jgi:hypothetical protein
MAARRGPDHRECVVHLLRRVVLVSALVLLAALAVSSAASAGWSGQNGKVIFNSFNNCCDRIWSVNPDGSGLRVLHFATSQYARIEEVSPDGTQIVFLDTGGTGNIPGKQVRSVPVDRAPTTPTTLLDFPAVEDHVQPIDGNVRYSPEGARLAFLRRGGAQAGVWVMDTDGSHKQLLFQTSAAISDLAWSADGSRLGFVDAGIPYSIPADGGSVPVAMPDPYSPSPGLSPVSPDGRKRAFVDCCDADMGGNPQVYVSNLDGSERRRLSDVYPDCQGVLPYCGFFEPFRPGQNQESGFAPDDLRWQAVQPPTSRVGLVAAYNFDAGTGRTVADLSGNGNTGTTRAASWVAGRHGGALSFNGRTSWMTVADSPSVNLSSAMTLEAWVRPTELSDGSWKSVIFKEQRKSTAYDLYASDGKVPATSIWNGSEQLAKGSAQLLPLDRWSHLAATLGDGTLRLYLNGNLIATRPNAGTITRDRSAKPLRIGGNNVFDEFFAGSIDDVRIYDRALSDVELRSDMFTAVS